MNELSEDQVRQLYAQEVAEHECLTALGYDSAEPPSQQQYIDTYQSADQYFAFLPAFDAMGQAEMNDAVRQCPPPTWFMNIDGL